MANSQRREGIHRLLHEFIEPLGEFNMAVREFIPTSMNSSSGR
jgi:hypothetical protein